MQCSLQQSVILSVCEESPLRFRQLKAEGGQLTGLVPTAHITMHRIYNIKGSLIMKEIINGRQVEIKNDFSEESLKFVIDGHLHIFDKEYHFKDIFFKNAVIKIGDFGKNYNAVKDFMLVAYVDGERMGSISGVGNENGDIHLRFFFLHEDARGMKLGKKLFTAAMDKCKEMGCSRIWFTTFNKLEVARSMYAKLGFTVTGYEKKEDIGDGVIEETWEKYI